jgi:hypothetical protein
MIIPPEPAALLLLRDGLALRAHIERMYPQLLHSPSWLAMLNAFELALEDTQRRHERHKEQLNERAQRDED